MARFLEHRIGDPRLLRLIQKWLQKGVLEDGVVTVSETGTGQGSVISPLLANVYLHYVFDLWAQRWRRREAVGDMIILRYADDIVVGFEREADARRLRAPRPQAVILAPLEIVGLHGLQHLKGNR
jgi:retron-type reverse transcriptase